MAATLKPVLQLKTPTTSTFPSQLSATFPSELSALSNSARSPLPGYADFIKLEDGIKTPITPPTAYTDFLKSMSPLTAPLTGSFGEDKPLSISSTMSSTPSTASSDHSNCSCNCDGHKSPSSTIASPLVYPASAPGTGRLTKLRIPQSPAHSTVDSPRSATVSVSSAVRSPFSARSPYDWDGINKSRFWDPKSPRSTRSGVRHVREVFTRTVTYTPRMSPAPRGKRRKVE